MDPQSVEKSSSLNREDVRPDTGSMEKSVVEIVGLKRKKFHFEIGSGSVNLEEEPIVAPKHARGLVEERSRPTAPAACKIDLTINSDSDDDDDCVITGFVMPEVTLPRTPADCSIALALDSDSEDEDRCVILGAGALAICGVVQVAHDSAAAESDCVITGWLPPGAVLIRDSAFVIDELLSASEAGDEEFSDSEYSVESVPASVSARESDDEFSTLESDGEISVSEWDADDDVCWGWLSD